MILRYFAAYMKILFSDRVALVTTLVCMVFCILFIDSLTEYVVRDRVIVAFDAEDTSTLRKSISNELKKDKSIEVIYISSDGYLEAIEEGDIDLYVHVANDAEQRMSQGDYDDLVVIYTGGISLYSVFYPELILGLLVEDTHQGIVSAYVEDLNDRNNTGGEEKDELKSIYESVVDGRNLNYFIETYLTEEAFTDGQTDLVEPDQNRGEILYRKRIIGIVILIIHLYIMVVSSRLVEEHENGSRKRLRISPAPAMSLFVGRYLVICFPASIMAVVTAAAMGYRSGNKGIFIPVMIELIAVTGVLSLLMLYISLAFKRSYRYVIVTVSLVMVMAILSGVFFDIEIAGLPPYLRRLTLYGPNIDRIVMFLTK